MWVTPACTLLVGAGGGDDAAMQVSILAGLASGAAAVAVRQPLKHGHMRVVKKVYKKLGRDRKLAIGVLGAVDVCVFLSLECTRALLGLKPIDVM